MAESVTTKEELLSSSREEKKQNNIVEKIMGIIEYIKGMFKSRKKVSLSPKKRFLIVWMIFLGMLWGAIGIAMMIYVKMDAWKGKEEQLLTLSKYGVTNSRNLEKEEIFTIQDLIEEKNNIKKQNERYTEYLTALQAPYIYFLKYLYLPSLNIWKDPFTEKIDVSIIGQKYLDKNPYEDTKLIWKWKNFFKNVWKNIEFNEVWDVEISSISIEKDHPDLFSITVKVPFVSNTKRSFLLLINKLSMTSGPKNISLIDEFSYFLWKEIKEKKKEMIADMKYNDPFFSWWNDDKIIGYNLYQWINNQDAKKLIDGEVVDWLVRNVMMCPDNLDDTRCYYKFREKYSSLPLLAYTVWVMNQKDKVKAIKDFYASIPMLMKVQSFSFDRVKDEKKMFMNGSLKYKWVISIKLYGKEISLQEVEEIWRELWVSCFGEGKEEIFDTTIALEKVESMLASLWEIKEINNNNGLNTSRIQKVWELKEVIWTIDSEYEKLSNYDKTIKLFEVYRMLKDADICKI